VNFRSWRTRAVASVGVAAVAGLALALTPALKASAAKTTAQAATTATASGGESQADANKALVLYFQDQLWNDGNLSVVDQYVSPSYIQHNPTVANGAADLKQLVAKDRAAFPTLHITTVRAVAEGDLVVLQESSGGLELFDMYRVDGGKIDEHWDVIESTPASTVSGNDMFAELSKPSSDAAPAAVTARDKGIAVNYVTALMQTHDLGAIEQYVSPSLYQHDPTLANGSAALEQSYSALFAQYPSFSVQIAQVVAEGDLVFVHAHLKDAPSELGQAVLYVFRVRDGKIVEQWDGVQNVPATSANDNTMF
jgi:predicted SnoaL-like aldol condensation-catalyzing enzyme